MERFQGHRFAFLIVLCAATLAACRKDLCYEHETHSLSVKVDALVSYEQEWEREYGHDWKEEWRDDWSCSYDELRPGIRTGIRVIDYPAAGGFSENNISAHGGRIPLKEGRSSVLFYNNDTEYIVFSRLPDVASATATTRTVVRGNFKALHSGERTMNQPDMLYGHFEENYEARKTVAPMELPVSMSPLVYTYMIRYEFSAGLKYVALARGALAGMAESVYLSDGHTGDQAATIMYEDCEIKPFGVEARVKSFGVPNYPGDHYSRADGTPQKYSLNLEVRMKNGRYKTFEFDVTDQIREQPRGGVIVVGGIEISDEEGEEGSGGFDSDVDGWGDFIDIPLPI